MNKLKDILAVLDPYLDADARQLLGSTYVEPPPKPLPQLDPGEPLYDVIDGWIKANWPSHSQMPTDLRDCWYRLLLASRNTSGNKGQRLLEFAALLRAKITLQPSLLERVLAVLTPKQQCLMEHVWDRKTTTYEVLRDLRGAFSDGVTDDAIKQTINRINKTLTTEGLPVTLTISGRRVNLKRPD